MTSGRPTPDLPPLRAQIALADFPPGQCARAIRLLEADEAAGEPIRSADDYLAAAYVEDSPYDRAWRARAKAK